MAGHDRVGVGAGVAGLASALGNAGFAALARQSQPRGRVAIDQPRPLLGDCGHATVRGSVNPRLAAANVALAAPKPSKGAIETAHANVRQAVATFRRLRSRGSDNGKLRPEGAETPTAQDFETDIAAIQAAIQELAALGPKLSPADVEAMAGRLEFLIAFDRSDSHRDYVKSEISLAREGMAGGARLERAVAGAKRRNADVIEKLQKLAATNERVARRRAGERDPVPDWDNPELPQPPPEPDPDAKPEWI